MGGGGWGQIFNFFQNFLEMVGVEFYRWFHQNSSKYFHLRSFWRGKQGFFLKKKSVNVSNFWQIFSRKIGSHRTTQTPNFGKFFLKNAIKHWLLGSHRTTNSAKIFGHPLPQIYLLFTLTYNSNIYIRVSFGYTPPQKGPQFQKKGF